MAAIEASLQAIYSNMVQEATARLIASERYLAAYLAKQQTSDLESAVLQVRKALEAIALASIAPNKAEYAAFRATATKTPDFTKDYPALRIFSALERINKKFYPIALIPAVGLSDGRNKGDGVELLVDAFKGAEDAQRVVVLGEIGRLRRCCAKRCVFGFVRRYRG